MLSWGKLVATGAGLAVAFLLGEVGLRLASPIRSQDLLPFPYRRGLVERIAMGAAYIRFDAHLGWTPALASAREVDGVHHITNGAGLRSDREYAVDPPPGVRRLAALGDSFTYCDEVDNPDCWTVGLEEAWPGTEVLNFGAPGYSPDQAWLRYQRDGRAYQPCAVLIGYQVENIHRVVNRFRPFYHPGTGFILSKPRFLLDDGGLRLLPNPATTSELLEDPRWVEANLGPHDAWYFPGMFVANPLDFSRVVRVVRTAAYRQHARARGTTGQATASRDIGDAYREEQEAYQITGRVLIEFARQVRQDGATPVVVVFGRREEIVALLEGGDKVYAPLVDWLAREGIPTIDVTDRLAREAQRTDVGDLFRRFEHYSPEANGVVAATLARRLPALTAATCAGSAPPTPPSSGG